MKTIRTEIVAVLADAARSAARRSQMPRFRRAEPEASLSIEETRRRKSILQELYRRYSVEAATPDGIQLYRDSLPPDGWINDHLHDRRELWRVHNVDGFRCEIFDVDA